MQTLKICFVGSENCGSNNFSPVQRVIGGSPEQKWPWMVSLGYYDGGIWSHQCGGTLVDYETVLTAAHCVFNEPRNELQ